MTCLIRIGKGCGWRFLLSWPLLVIKAGVFAFVIGSDWAVSLFLER